MTLFKDVKKQTTEDYFNNNEFSIDAFNKKYSLYEGETYVKALKRVCCEIASVESTEELKNYWSERWFDEIYNDWWHPAGSIMQGAGASKGVSLANCVTISLGNQRYDEEWDNLESIIRNTAYSVAKSAAYRQGLGVDFSRLRPKGTDVNNSANESTGAVHWMGFIDSIAYYVGQKGRIPAFLFSLSCKHPDIEEFITVKKDFTKIQNANISVQCLDQLYKDAEKDLDWDLVFEIPALKKGGKTYIDVHSADKNSLVEEGTGRFYKIVPRDRKKQIFQKTIKAKKLLELIAQNMTLFGEPGIQNTDIIEKYSNSNYVYDPDDEYDSRVISSNACSEQMLSRDSQCILASLNGQKFSVDVDIRSSELKKIAYSMNRFLDDVNEKELQNETYATPHQGLAIRKLRRTGAGYTNIAGLLFKMNLEYGSEEGNEAIEDFTKTYNFYLYESSIALGKEKGNFELFSKEKFTKSPFVKRMEGLGLEFDTMRNVTCSSIAPTGTLSTQFRDYVMSYGIEPAFGMYYWKRTRISGKYEYYFCVPNIVRQVFAEKALPIPIDSDTIKDTWDGKRGESIAKFIDENKHSIGIKFCKSTEVPAANKLELMSKVMKWIDSSISVTYMLPEDSDWKDVYKFIIQAWKKEVKSIAAFPDKKMYGIISDIPFKSLALKLINENVEIHSQNFSGDELEQLNISKENVTLHTDGAPKRLDILDGEIHIATSKGDKFVIIIGFQNGLPYEMFGGHANGLKLKNNTACKIIKIRQGKYSLEIGDITIEDITQQFTPTEKILFRLISLMLRSGIPIHFIIEQLGKATEDVTSVAAAAARILKKHIKEGQKVSGQGGCPSCSSPELFYHDGCVSCSCGWSKCS